MEFDKKMIGSRIRDLRMKNSLTVSQLAEMIGVDQSTLSNMEAGRRAPSLERARKLSLVFDVSLDYLIGLTDNPTRNL